MSYARAVAPSAPSTAPAASASAVSPAQPYGNAAAQEDAGLAATPLTDEAAYVAVLARSWIDYAAVLEAVLDDPRAPGHRRWLDEQTFDDVREQAPLLLDRAREAFWPPGRTVQTHLNASFVAAFGGTVTGAASIGRDDGVHVELTGELTAAAGFGGLAGMGAVGDEAVLLGASAGATVEAGARARAAWSLPDDALDGTLGGCGLGTGLDAVVKAIDTVIAALTTPDELEIEALDRASAGAALGAGVAASLGASAESSVGAGYDADCRFVTASIAGGVASGFDARALQALGATIGNAVAAFDGTIGVRAEQPLDGGEPRYWFCWTTATERNDGRRGGAGSDSTWVEVGGLTAAIPMLRDLLALGAASGPVDAAALPDRTLVRSVERPITDPARIADAARATGLAALDPAFAGVQDDTTLTACGGLRITTDAVRAALGGAPLDPAGASVEDALLDVERQIAAWFLGDTYVWPGAAQVRAPERGVAAAEVTDARLEATRSFHTGAQGGAGSVAAGTTVTEAIALAPAEVRAYMAA